MNKEAGLLGIMSKSSHTSSIFSSYPINPHGVSSLNIPGNVLILVVTVVIFVVLTNSGSLFQFFFLVAIQEHIQVQIDLLEVLYYFVFIITSSFFSSTWKLD
jgi:hypothetical protein